MGFHTRRFFYISYEFHVFLGSLERVFGKIFVLWGVALFFPSWNMLSRLSVHPSLALIPCGAMPAIQMLLSLHDSNCTNDSRCR